MQLILALLLSVVVLAGAAPRSMQEELERRLPWWHSRLMGAVSSFVEFFFGWQMLRQVLLRDGLGVLGTVGAWVLGSIAFFLLSEGILDLPRRSGHLKKPVEG